MSIYTLLSIMTLIFIPELLQAHTQPQSIRCWPDYGQDLIAQARTDNNICLLEAAALSNRTNKARATLQRFMGQDLDTNLIPRIALACSGGGLRAALATLGVLRGLEKIGLIDAIEYIGGTSGSTWTIASWIWHKKSLVDLSAYLADQVSSPLDIKDLSTLQLVQSITSKCAMGREISVNDAWGGTIANLFLHDTGKNGFSAHLSDLASDVIQGTYPIPVVTSVIGETSPTYQFVECTPFEIGSTYLNAWIPTNTFGKYFEQGKTYDQSPEETLGFVLGFCSSAYACNFNDIIDNVSAMLTQQNNTTLSGYASWLANNIRISPPEVFNFSYRMPTSPLQQLETMSLIDSGVALNMPIPALLRRSVAVYIICDATGNNLSTANNEMRKVELYAKQHNHPFPPINYDRLITQKISIHLDYDNPQTPIVIYIPNFVAFSTLKTNYSAEEFNQIVGGTESAITQAPGIFKQALGIATNNKKSIIASQKPQRTTCKRCRGLQR